MVRIWGKVMKKDKILKDFVFYKEDEIDWSAFFTYLTEICAALDVPTPVLLKTHVLNFAKYNFVKFTASDFIEPLPVGDRLVLENIAER